MENVTVAITTASYETTVFQKNQSLVGVPFTNTGALISAIILLPLVVIGLIGNGLTICVIWKSKKLRSPFNLLIASLCVSDFLSALIAPLFLYRRTLGFQYWAIGSFLCKTFWGTDVMTSIATAFHILGFSLFRLISIAFTTSYNRITKRHTMFIIMVSWTISLGCGFVPFAIWMDSRVIDRRRESSENTWPSCTISRTWLDQFRSYTIYGYSIFFYCPLLLIIIVSTAVSVLICLRRKQRLKKRESSRRSTSSVKPKKETTEYGRQKKENIAILQLGLIVGSFMIGYIPHCAYYLLATKLPSTTEHERTLHFWFGMSEHMLLRVSECLNPVFYNLSSSKMREETLQFLMSIHPCFRRMKSNNEAMQRSSKSTTRTVSSAV